MNTAQYRGRLLELEKELSERIDREVQHGRDQFLDVAADAGDTSVVAEEAAVEFGGADMDSTLLTQVRDALGRLDAGTFGRCVVDGGPIEPERLEASPWSQYCIKHQKASEEDSPRHSTL